MTLEAAGWPQEGCWDEWCRQSPPRFDLVEKQVSGLSIY